MIKVNTTVIGAASDSKQAALPSAESNSFNGSIEFPPMLFFARLYGEDRATAWNHSLYALAVWPEPRIRSA